MWAVRHNVVALIATVAASLAGSASARIITDFTPPEQRANSCGNARARLRQSVHD